MVYHQATLDRTFAALADPTRRAILAHLVRGEQAIGALAAGFAMSLPAVSKHVRVLERAGLASVEKRGRVRVTRLVARPMRDAAAWLEHYRAFWEYQLDLLADYLESSPSRTAEDSTCQPRNRQRRKASASKSGASSPRRESVSSTRGRRPPSFSGGTRRAK
ncbi:MAG: helix-turn-helix transcriptional regulator [Gemmatimonadaceae bacterium]|nr:helix-turn-helix transcriptional regulator [Gemmatimonadaceae bacterium]